MEAGTIAMMVIMLGIVWGEFVYLLIRMMKQKKTGAKGQGDS